MIFEIAGITISSISTIAQLYGTIKDARKWPQQYLQIDSKWVPRAVAEGILPGSVEDYGFMQDRKMPGAELEGTHEVVIGVNEDTRTFYRLVRDDPSYLTVLVRRLKDKHKE